jgi:hypothetical protein
VANSILPAMERKNHVKKQALEENILHFRSSAVVCTEFQGGKWISHVQNSSLGILTIKIVK